MSSYIALCLGHSQLAKRVNSKYTVHIAAPPRRRTRRRIRARTRGTCRVLRIGNGRHIGPERAKALEQRGIEVENGLVGPRFVGPRPFLALGVVVVSAQHCAQRLPSHEKHDIIESAPLLPPHRSARVERGGVAVHHAHQHRALRMLRQLLLPLADVRSAHSWLSTPSHLLQYPPVLWSNTSKSEGWSATCGRPWWSS